MNVFPWNNVAQVGPFHAWLCLAALLCLFGLLGSVAVSDIFTRRIPNIACLAIAGMSVAYWWAGVGLAAFAGLYLHLIVIIVLGIVLIGLYAFELMGGGDVKLLLAVAFWLPGPSVPAMLVHVALLGGILGLVCLVRRRITHGTGPQGVPYGVAIAAGTVMAIYPAFTVVVSLSLPSLGLPVD